MKRASRKPEQEKVTILDNAKALVYGDRAAAYGHPKDNFWNIAQLQNAYLVILGIQQQEVVLDATDIAIMNILQKVARLATNKTHIDSVIDIAGYAATIERIIDAQH